MIQYLYVIGAVHLMICPFTKVEESFNIQAMHDIIYHKWNFTEFDHYEFPGVVPRTFLGPIIITLLLSPLLTVVDLLGLIASNKFICQYLVRAALGCCVLYSFQRLYKSVKDSFGEGVAIWFFLITASQYHFMFYLSRPLPNILALPLVLLAVSSWIKQDHMGLICFSAAAVVIFRFELAFFLGLMILIEIIRKNISFFRVLKIGIFASIFALVTTVAVDSIFWNRLVWPEGEVFWFNVILNKSSAWGVSPFFWYWYSALPRALGTSITLVPFGDKQTKVLIVPALLFISLMSFLPHKELRFIIYTFPLLNISAASFCNRIWTNKHKSMTRWICSIYLILHLLANVFLTCILIKVASNNYPGGQAMARLHQLVPPSNNAHIYIDNLAAQTGVSKFTQINHNWIYNKTENLPTGSDNYVIFTHLLLEAKSKYSLNLKPFLSSHEILDVIEGFSHIHFNYNSFPPFKIKCKPMIFILKRNYTPKEELKIDEPKRVSTVETNVKEIINKTMDLQISNSDNDDVEDNDVNFIIETKNEYSDIDSNDKIILNLTEIESKSDKDPLDSSKFNGPDEIPEFTSNMDESEIPMPKVLPKIDEPVKVPQIWPKVDESGEIPKIMSKINEPNEFPKFKPNIDETNKIPKIKARKDEPDEDLKIKSREDEVLKSKSWDEVVKISTRLDEADEVSKIKSRVDKIDEVSKIRPRLNEAYEIPKIKSRIDTPNELPKIRSRQDENDEVPKVKPRIDTPDELPKIRSRQDEADEVSKIKSRIDTPDELPKIRSRQDEADEVSKIKSRIDTLNELPKITYGLAEAEEVPKIKSKIDGPDELPKIRSRLDETAEVPRIKSKIDTSDEVPKIKPRVEELDEIPKIKSRIDESDEVPRIRLKVENTPKTPLKMNIDDFFEEFNENPSKANSKKFSINKTVKISSLKDKTAKIKTSSDLEK